MEQSRITIQIVGWNSAPVLPALIASLKHIPPQEAEIIYIDNASSDNSLSIVKKLLPTAHCISLQENTGFTGAHNIGFANVQTDFVLIVNPDVVLNWNGTKQLLSVFKDSKVAAVQGKLMRTTNPSVIDSTGITQTITLNGRERGAGEVDKGQFNTSANVLATTGAYSLFKMSALRKAAYGTYTLEGHTALEVFDKDFFAYKEDVDLGWRLKNLGFKNVYYPIVVGTHPRTLKHEGAIGWGISAARIVKRLKDVRTKLSLRNYAWMVAKNATPTQFLVNGFFTELRLLTYLLLSLFYWPLASVWFDILEQMPHIMNKRYETRNHHR